MKHKVDLKVVQPPGDGSGDLEPSLEILATRINERCVAADVAARSALENAWYAGKDLLEVKARLPHGEFGPWCEKHVKVSRHQYQRYMVLAEGYFEAIPEIAFNSIADAIAALKPPPKVEPPSKPRPKEEPYIFTEKDYERVFGSQPNNFKLIGPLDREAALKALLVLVIRPDVLPKIFKLLKQIYHPDKGGETSQFQQLTDIERTLLP